MSALETISLGNVNFSGPVDDLVLPTGLTFFDLSDKSQGSLDLGFLAPSSETLRIIRMLFFGNMAELSMPVALEMPAVTNIEVIIWLN